jgi:multidrug efflux system outer membrane protein
MRFHHKLMVGMSSGLLLGACGSMAPAMVRPAMPVPVAYPQAAGQAAVLPAWQDYFVDPALRRLIEQALSNNRDLRIAVARVAQARAAYGIQRAAQFPLIGVQASEARSRTPADLNLTRQPLVASDYQVGIGLASWELDFWGRVHDLKASALETYLAGDDRRRAATTALIAEVANGYFQLREFDERIALAKQTVASRRETLRIFSRREAVGATARLAVTQVEVLLTQAQSLLVQLQQAREAQWQALALLVGDTPALPVSGTALDERALMGDLAAGLPAQLLDNRPDIMAAEHQLRAASASIGAARAAFFPQISLTGAFGTASAELKGLFDGGSRAWQFSPTISLPLFDGGLRRQNLTLAEARRDEAVANYERTVQQAFRDVADALSARSALTEQLAIAERAFVAQRERAHLAQLRYDNGAAPYLEVLDASRELLTAEQQQVQVRRALLSSRVALYASLGGGAPAATLTN